MNKLALPPRIKVLEALSALGDGRVFMKDDKNAVVVSSDGSRQYSVFVDFEKKIASSTDNGTVYRGYIGYPIISVLMLKGMLPYNKDLAEKLKGINWRHLNEKYRRYYIVEKIVKNIFSKRGGNIEELDKFVERVMEELSKLDLSKSE